jgi:hypothetical protein
MLEARRSHKDRVQAALGLQALQYFIPQVRIPVCEPDEPVSDDRGGSNSKVDGFSAINATEQAIAAQSVTLLEEFVEASIKAQPNLDRTLILMEVTALFLATISRAAQDIGAGFIDADEAKKRMEWLIYDRTQELLREHSRGVH